MRLMTQSLLTENTIRGSCPLFVCRICRTKYGWAHQMWCDAGTLTEPVCTDCRYYSTHSKECAHPAVKVKKEGRNLADEED